MNIFLGWIFLKSEHLSEVNIFKEWIFLGVNIFSGGEYFSGVNIFQGWIFFRGEYFSGVNIFRELIFFRGKYFPGVNLFRVTIFHLSTHCLNIWVSHNLLCLFHKTGQNFPNTLASGMNFWGTLLPRLRRSICRFQLICGRVPLNDYLLFLH